ncbi:MAG: hypothetical protein ACT4OP_11990 [Actinomycetota bacterium]
MAGSWERQVSAWPVGAWVMVPVLPIVAVVGVSATVFSPGLALDAISLWPGLMPALVGLIVIAVRRAWWRRSGAIPPLWILTWMSLAVAVHLSGWAALPSASAELTGGPSRSGLVSVTASPAGRLVIGPERGVALYRVRFLRLGGEVGVPVADEVTRSDSLAVTVRDAGTTDWFRYAGWHLLLSTSPTWGLNLRGDVSADLSTHHLASLALAGTGRVTLGATDRSVRVTVTGAYELIIPAGTAAAVTGPASVPAGWQTSQGVTSAPTEGNGWDISVLPGASLVIIEA